MLRGSSSSSSPAGCRIISSIVATWSVTTAGSCPANVPAFAWAMERPALYRLAARALRLAPRAADNETLPVVREWTRGREGLKPSPESFREIWERGIE